MVASIVKVSSLSHQYNSKNWAVKDVSFNIETQGIMGLLGSNGAGKSTIMNILCGVLKPTEGKVLINGIDISEKPVEAKSQIGFLPQTAPLYPDLTVDEYLTYCAHLRLMKKTDIGDAVKSVKERCEISHFSSRLLRNLSGGYRQRVGIAQAIIHKPKLVVFDEPTNGLDPNQILEVRNLIKDIATDRAVIFSSHILSEVQATCKDIKMIEKGNVVFSGSMEAFNNYVVSDTIIATFSNKPSLEELLAIDNVSHVEFLEGNKIRLRSNDPKQLIEMIVETSVKKGWHLQEIGLEKISLDAIFAQLSGKKTIGA